MKENRQRSIYWRLLALASLLMVGIFSALFYFHLRSQTAMLEQISRQQQQLTSRIASGMEHALWQVQSKLEQLAHSPLRPGNILRRDAGVSAKAGAGAGAA